MGSPLEPSLGCSGLGEIKRTWVPPSRCSVYDLLHEPRLRYLENVHLKPAFRLCVRGHVFTQSTSAELPPNATEGREGSRGKFLVLEIKRRDRGTLLWSQEILMAWWVRRVDSLGCVREDSVEISQGALRINQQAGKQVCAKALGQDLLSVSRE